MDNSPNQNSLGKANDVVAVCVAILAAFMAVAKVKDDNIVQAMLKAKSDAVDSWAEYQSKRIKHHLFETARDQVLALITIGGDRAEAQLRDQIQHYEAEIQRYTKEEKTIQEKAKKYEELYDTLNYKDDRFDLSDASFSISLGMLAVTALPRRRWRLYLSPLFAGFGVVMGLVGLLGLTLHPDRLTKLLS